MFFGGKDLSRKFHSCESECKNMKLFYFVECQYVAYRQSGSSSSETLIADSISEFNTVLTEGGRQDRARR
jgi:hypothetical protein